MIYAISGTFQRGILLFFFLLLNIPVKADFFHLKNGKVFEGTLKSETSEDYVVEILGGSTRLKKNSVTKIEKQAKQLTPLEDFQFKISQANSPDALLAAAEFGIKNGLNAEALVLLKRMWNEGGRKDASLKSRIQRLDEKQLSDISDKAQKLFKAEKFRSCADLLNHILKQDFLSNTVSLLQIKKQTYDRLDSEQASRDYLDELILNQKHYSISGDKGMKKTPPNSSLPSAHDTSLTKAKDFQIRQMKLDPIYSQVIDSLTQLLELQRFIEKGGYDIAASQALHGIKELDQAHGKPKEFNRLRTENNKIYQARKTCRQHNYLLGEIKNQMDHIEEIITNDSEAWVAKGYEKVHGYWLKGDAAKEAKGLEQYRGEWVDPKDPDIEKIKLGIDRKYGVVQQPNEIEKPSKSQIVSATSTALGNDDSSLIENRSPKNLMKQIKSAVEEEVTQAVTQKIEDTKDRVKTIKNAINTSPENLSATKEDTASETNKGLSMPVGLGLIGGILLLLTLTKKKS